MKTLRNIYIYASLLLFVLGICLEGCWWITLLCILNFGLMGFLNYEYINNEFIK